VPVKFAILFANLYYIKLHYRRHLGRIYYLIGSIKIIHNHYGQVANDKGDSAIAESPLLLDLYLNSVAGIGFYKEAQSAAPQVSNLSLFRLR
jgi:hypothetical protein